MSNTPMLDAAPMTTAPRSNTRERKARTKPQKPSLLSQLQCGKHPGPRRTLVYGVQGVGKSTFAAQAPGAIFVPTEDGTGDLDCTRFPLMESFEGVLQALTALYREQHDFQTVVIDSLDWLERLVWERVCKDQRVESIEQMPYKVGYVYALDHWRRVQGARHGGDPHRALASGALRVAGDGQLRPLRAAATPSRR